MVVQLDEAGPLPMGHFVHLIPGALSKFWLSPVCPRGGVTPAAKVAG